MDDKTINAVVDNLAAKIGVAADNLQPIAETLVRETQMKWMLSAVVAMIVFSVVAWVQRQIWNAPKGEDEQQSDYDNFKFGSALVAAAICLLAFLFASEAAIKAMSPTLTLIESLK